MLISLSIRNVVLIEKLDIDFQGGLSVLTGETGTGKSILLDSLSLAMGARAESRLVRQGADKASVTAIFSLPQGHEIEAILDEQEVDFSSDEDIVLRRTVTPDGRSKAFVNDEPVSAKTLKKIGDSLIEIHGQFESHGLLDTSSHCAVLDEFGALISDVNKCKEAFANWHEAAKKRKNAEEELEQAKRDEELLRHNLDEMEKLSVKEGEDEELASRRSMLMNSEKIIEAINSSYNLIATENDISAYIRKAQANLETIAELTDGKLDNVIEALERASIEVSEATSLLESCAEIAELNPAELEELEERLFAIRSLARKHGIEPDELPALQEDLTAKLASLEKGNENIAELAAAEEKARSDYMIAAKSLSEKRHKTARKLDEAVASELPPLKLEKAVFETEVKPLPEEQWSAGGWDAVSFNVATNPGTSPAPINKIASGGELARFMLALKVNLSKTGGISTIVFDEVDTGISGATAEAVGRRLARLAEEIQVLVITHSPQVAARGEHHLRVEKIADEKKNLAITQVNVLNKNEREKEVARMLAGEHITDEALAAARKLLG